MLVVCTGNQCRSPLAEALLRRGFAAAGIEGRVSSAGIISTGTPASKGSLAVAAEHGLDLGEHRSRLLTADLLQAADLVIAMARVHVREAVVRDPDVFGRTFTLRELVRRGESIGPSRGTDLVGWLRAASLGRRAADLMGDDPLDDIDDPMGQPLARYRQTYAEIDELVDRLVALLRPVVATGASVAPAGSPTRSPTGSPTGRSAATTATEADIS